MAWLQIFKCLLSSHSRFHYLEDIHPHCSYQMVLILHGIHAFLLNSCLFWIFISASFEYPHHVIVLKNVGFYVSNLPWFIIIIIIIIIIQLHSSFLWSVHRILVLYSLQRTNENIRMVFSDYPPRTLLGRNHD